jgi:hypothetical protein
VSIVPRPGDAHAVEDTGTISIPSPGAHARGKVARSPAGAGSHPIRDEAHCLRPAIKCGIVVLLSRRIGKLSAHGSESP